MFLTKRIYILCLHFQEKCKSTQTLIVKKTFGVITMLFIVIYTLCNFSQGFELNTSLLIRLIGSEEKKEIF